MIVDLEFLPCIHRKLVNHRLAKQTVVTVCGPQGFPSAMVSSLTEIAIGKSRSRAKQQCEGNDKDGHERINQFDVDDLQQTDQSPMHPFIAISSTFISMLPRIHFFFSEVKEELKGELKGS